MTEALAPGLITALFAKYGVSGKLTPLAVGRELARLHRLVTVCPDPDGYLDTPGDEPEVESLLAALVDGGRLEIGTGRDLEAACRELAQAPRVPNVA